MSVVTTNNKINQQQQILFNEDMDDPVTRQNFDTLQKYLLRLQRGTQPPAANIVKGTVLIDASTGNPSSTLDSSTTLKTPSSLTVQITTKGNPVKVRIGQPLFSRVFDGATVYASVFGYQRSANPGTSLGMVCGWLRNGVQVSSQYIHDTLNAGVTNTSYLKYFPLPFCEFEDINLPAGTYNYQFYYQNTTGTAAFFQNVCAIAEELK